MKIEQYIMGKKFVGFVVVRTVFLEGKGGTVIEKHFMDHSGREPVKIKVADYGDQHQAVVSHRDWVQKTREEIKNAPEGSVLAEQNG